MVDSIASSLHIAARNAATRETPHTPEAPPSVAPTAAADEFPPSPARLVFAPASQGRFASTESFVAVVQAAGETPALFGVRPATTAGDPRAAQTLTRQLDALAGAITRNAEEA